MTIVNTRLLKHPLNWLTIWSMVFLLSYVAHLLISYVQGKHPGSPSIPDSEGVAGPGTTDTSSSTAA